MGNEKKYYWLKLKEGFFGDKPIKKLRTIAGGDTYTIIYLKLMLLSLKENGRLYYDGIEETFYEELALEIDENADNVKITLVLLQKMGLLEEISESEAFLTQIPECVGSETAGAERVRKFRQRQNRKALQCNTDVTKCNTEIDIEKEKETEIREENNNSDSETESIYSDIVSYLNLRAEKNYKVTTPKTKTLIKARLKEGFTLDDFKLVIDKKCREWMGTEWAQYLRPSTLFGTKFEEYLNANVNLKKEEKSEYADFMQQLAAFRE